MSENKIYAGLSWPEKGNTGYYCVVRENPVPEDKKFVKGDPSIEIVREGLVEGFSFLKDLKKDHCSYIYTMLENKYNSFIRDFSDYKRENNIDIRLRNAPIPAPEAAILKIKEFIKEKRIIFPEDSLVRSQLTVFSKDTLLDPVPAYAVRALCMVIGKFKKPRTSTPTTGPKLSAWW
jgi:hypothetical protein